MMGKNLKSNYYYHIERLKSYFSNHRFKKIPRLIVKRYRKFFGIYNPFFNTHAVLTREEMNILDLFDNGRDSDFIINKIQNIKSDKRLEATIDFLFSLFEKRFVIHDSTSTDDLIKTVQDEGRDFTASIPVNTLVVIPSLSCNFSCTYCYHLKSFSHVNYASLKYDALKSGVDLFIRNYNSVTSPVVRFIGGEPLIHFNLIERIAGYINKRASDFHFNGHYPKYILITNGSLINNKLSLFLKAYNFSVGISIDGSENINDKCRVLQNGSGTFKSIMKGINTLIKREIPFSITLTIGKHNICEIEKELKWIAKNITKAIVFNFMLDFFDGKNKQYLSKYALSRHLRNIYDCCDALGIVENKYDARLSAFEANNPILFHCNAMGGQIVLSPNGSAGPCHHLVSEISRNHFVSIKKVRGNIHQKSPWNHWINRSPIFIRECYEKCDYFTFCGGGCAASAISRGNGLGIDEDICMLTKFYLDHILLKKCREYI